MRYLRYLYHSLAALALNLQAKYWSAQMRKGVRGSGTKLINIGAQSNRHERERDNALKAIKEWWR